MLFIVCLGFAVLMCIFLYLQQRHLAKASVPYVDITALNTLPTKDASKIDTRHVADGLTPPTNKWFSGLALQAAPKTVFPTPLSFTPSETAFTIDLPEITASANTIFNTRTSPVTVMVAGATQYQVTRYDELSVDLTYRNPKKTLGTVTLMAGSPYIYFNAAADTRLMVQSAGGETKLTDKTASFLTDTRKTTVAGFNGTRLSRDGSTITAHVPAKGLATFYALPLSMDDTQLLTAADSRITGATVSYKKTGESYQTSIRLATSTGNPTFFGLLPHQTYNGETAASFDTLYGEQRLIKASDVVFTTKSISVQDSLNIDHISEVNKELLRTTLRRDINATQITAEDTYFGGKQLYRSAQLLKLAEQLNEDGIAGSIQRKLRQELSTWLSSTTRLKKYFYYDTKVHGLVGETPAFGSEEFNDHHFHYGYFIYAASILAQYDSDFLRQYKTMVDLLVADIANYREDEPLPLRRLYDPYFGHSWASGSAPFDDGNNQESTSEAINAWIAAGLWAKQTSNTALFDEAQWMLSNEAQATKSYWMEFNRGETPYNLGYDHSIVALNWGGKRDYATFFSGAPSAMLGIQLIPLSPTMTNLAPANDRIDEHTHEATGENTYAMQFGDYILMYQALRKDGDYLSNAIALPDEFIDGANSRSYLYAWIMSR